jgi:hypothetical protein
LGHIPGVPGAQTPCTLEENSGKMNVRIERQDSTKENLT